MSNDPYAEVTIRSPNKSAMASIIVGMFVSSEIPVWIKPGAEDSFTVAYPLLRVMEAQNIFKQIESYKTNEKAPDRNGSLLDGPRFSSTPGEVDGGTRTETDAQPPTGQ